MSSGQKRMWVKVEEGSDGNPIERLPGGKVVLFRRNSSKPALSRPPVGRLVDTVIVEEHPNKCIGEWTGAMKPQ